MKLKVLVLALLLAAGVAASAALAKGPPPGKGHRDDAATTATPTTSTTADKKVTVCHKTGNGSFRKIRISKKALPAHLKHGDSEVAAGASCTTP